AALTALRKAADSGVYMNLYLSLVLDAVRAVLLVRFAPELRKELAEELGADEYKEIEALAAAKDSKVGHGTLKAFLDAATRIRFSPVPSLPLELAVLELFPDA